MEALNNIGLRVLQACGVWLVGLAVYFVVLRPSLLPEDVRYMGTNLGEVQSALPGWERWLQRAYTVVGGFMVGAGVLTVCIAMPATAARDRWTWTVLALAGSFTDVHVTAHILEHFGLSSDVVPVADVGRLTFTRVVGRTPTDRERARLMSADLDTLASEVAQLAGHRVTLGARLPMDR
jgi:hypothetical protein